MSNYLNNLLDDLFDFPSHLETVDLEPKHYEEALQLSQNIGNEAKQWSVYLQALAVLAFAEWLNKREPIISLTQEISSIFKPKYVNLIDVICNLEVGKFKVCLIPTISFSDDEIILPRAVIDLPEFAAHFYIVIAINEELEIAAIRGFISYNEIVNYKLNYQSEFTPQRDWTYILPFSWFNSEPDELLLYLQSALTSTITLPEIPANRRTALSQIQRELINLLPQVNTSPLWQILTWSQGVAVLTSPELLNWLYNFPASDSSASNTHLLDLLQILSQQGVNIQRWLNNQFDDIIQAFSWEVLPAIRGTSDNIRQEPAEELEVILREINRDYDSKIPDVAVRAYQDIILEIPLRIYAVTWILPDDEWSLLLILKAISGHQPPSGFKLRVSDQTSVLVEEEIQYNSYHDYIFAQVVGSYDDKFMVTITSPNGMTQSLPPFESSKE